MVAVVLRWWQRHLTRKFSGFIPLFQPCGVRRSQLRRVRRLPVVEFRLSSGTPVPHQPRQCSASAPGTQLLERPMGTLVGQVSLRWRHAVLPRSGDAAGVQRIRTADKPLAVKSAHFGAASETCAANRPQRRLICINDCLS